MTSPRVCDALAHADRERHVEDLIIRRAAAIQAARRAGKVRRRKATNLIADMLRQSHLAEKCRECKATKVAR